MTPEAQRIAIAEACGYRWYWRVNGNSDAGFIWFLLLAFPPEEGIGTAWKGCAGETRAASESEIRCAKQSGAFTNSSPNYPTDLNAMHEAEKTLRNNQFHYVNYFGEVFKSITCGKEWKGELGYFGFMLITANAAQRAEAFLRTIGAWESEKPFIIKNPIGDTDNPSTYECSCPSVACPVHGLPNKSASGGW